MGQLVPRQATSTSPRQSTGLTTRPIQAPISPSTMGIMITLGLRQIRAGLPFFSSSPSVGSENSKCLTRVAMMTSISRTLHAVFGGCHEMSDLRADEFGGGGTHANRQPMHPCGPPAVKNESAGRVRNANRTSLDSPIYLQKFNLRRNVRE